MTFKVERIGRDAAFLSTWEGLHAEQAGESSDIAGTAERSVQVEGEFDGASVVIEGSNDGAHYHALTSPAGLRVEFKTPGLEALAEVTHYLRPRIAGGGSATTISVYAMERVNR